MHQVGDRMDELVAGRLASPETRSEQDSELVGRWTFVTMIPLKSNIQN